MISFLSLFLVGQNVAFARPSTLRVSEIPAFALVSEQAAYQGQPVMRFQLMPMGTNVSFTTHGVVVRLRADDDGEFVTDIDDDVHPRTIVDQCWLTSGFVDGAPDVPDATGRVRLVLNMPMLQGSAYSFSVNCTLKPWAVNGPTDGLFAVIENAGDVYVWDDAAGRHLPPNAVWLQADRTGINPTGWSHVSIPRISRLEASTNDTFTYYRRYPPGVVNAEFAAWDFTAPDELYTIQLLAMNFNGPGAAMISAINLAWLDAGVPQFGTSLGWFDANVYGVNIRVPAGGTTTVSLIGDTFPGLRPQLAPAFFSLPIDGSELRFRAIGDWSGYERWTITGPIYGPQTLGTGPCDFQ